MSTIVPIIRIINDYFPYFPVSIYPQSYIVIMVNALLSWIAVSRNHHEALGRVRIYDLYKLPGVVEIDFASHPQDYKQLILLVCFACCSKVLLPLLLHRVDGDYPELSCFIVGLFTHHLSEKQP